MICTVYLCLTARPKTDFGPPMLLKNAVKAETLHLAPRQVLSPKRLDLKAETLSQPIPQTSIPPEP